MLRFARFTCAALAAATACTPSPPVPPTVCATTPSITAPPACTADRPIGNGMPKNGMPKNGMPKNGMPKNGLSVAALRDNRKLLDTLASRPLSEHLFRDPDDPQAEPAILREPFARDLMSYITSCALDPCELIDAPGGAPFEGELGLCSGTFAARAGQPELASWRTSRPSSDCLERVSACVLARVNAINARVVFSMRGPGMTLAPRVPVETQFREGHGTDIASFRACAAGCQADPLRRNCDWAPRHVGQCVQGSQVRLALAPRKDIGPPTRIRICRGIYGCDDPAPEAGKTTPPIRDERGPVVFPPYYGGRLIDQGWDAVAFACPSNGPDGTGYYSVMLGTAGPPLDPDSEVRLVEAPLLPAAYPAGEAAVFSYREGGFYGTLWPDPPGAPPPPDPDRSLMLSGSQYACYSAIWDDGAATLANRLCAGPSSQLSSGCFVNPPGPCDPIGDRQGRCDAKPSAAPVAHTCVGVLAGSEKPSSRWHAPYTAYLNHPCDLFRSVDDCQRAGRLADGVSASPQP